MSLLHRLPGFVTGEFLDSSCVAASLESGLEPDINDAQGDFDGNHALPD